MATEQLALLEELSGGQLYSSAILGTYEFDGEFFENEILPVLNQLDVTNIVVLTDTEEYTGASNLTQAGKSYYIDHVRCPKIHHPKFVALFGHDHGRAFIGSANLTKRGWQQNGELMTVVDYPTDTAEPVPLFAQLRDFIEQSAAQIHSSRATTAIEEAFRDAPWLPEASAGASDNQVQLLHNHSEPLLPQILECIGDQPIEEIEICSPFFSGTDDATFAALNSLSPEAITINLQPTRVEGFDSEVFNNSYFDDIDLTVNKIALTDEDANRYLHAKLLLLKGSAGVWAFFGSPNFTTPALLNTGTDGNIELGVLRHESDPQYFDYLIDAETVSRESITPESIECRHSRTADTTVERPDFYLTDAYLEDEGTLVIEHEEETPPKATIHIRQATEDSGPDIDISDPGGGQLRCQDERVLQICRQSAQVEITLRFEDNPQISDARWVALPALEQMPRPSEIQTVETSNGRDGLLEVLNRLPNWGLICEFLDNIDIETGGGGGRVLPGGTQGWVDDDNTGMEEWDPKRRDEILEDKATALLRNIEAKREDLILNLTDIEEFESFVNQYIALSKLVLWWECQEPGELPHLQKVRRATKKIGYFIESLARHSELEAARAMEREHALFEHVAIIMCYVDQLQQEADYDIGANQHVYAVFQDTNREVLEAFGKLRGQSVPTAERIEDCIDEYSAIGAVSVSAKRVEYYCKGVLD